MADAVCLTLEAQGIRCWVAPRDITPGMEFAESIIEAINATRIMVLMFSSNANESPQVRREVERAVSKSVVIIPVRIEDIVPTGSMEYYLSTPHWFDAFTPPFQQHFDKLVETVKAVPAGGAAARSTRPALESAARSAATLPGLAPSPRPDVKPVSWGVRNIKVITLAVLAIVAAGLLANALIFARTKAPGVSTTASGPGGGAFMMLGISQSHVGDLNLTSAQLAKLETLSREARQADDTAMRAAGGSDSATSRAAIQKSHDQFHQRALAVLTTAQIAIVQKYHADPPAGGLPDGGGPGLGPPPGGGPPSDGSGPPPPPGGGQ